MADEPTPGTNDSGDAGDADQLKKTGAHPDAGGSSGDKDTFTKDEVERIVQGRVAKFSDYDDVKSELQKLRDKDKSDLDKASDRATRAEKEREAAREELAEVRRESAVTKVATDLKFINPSRAYRLLDADAITVDADGKPDSAGIKKALEALVESDPYLVGQSRPRGDAGGGPRGQSAPESMNDLIRSSIRR